MKLVATMPDGRPRCQARISCGSAWDDGRKQCSKPAKDGEAFCHIHERQWQRRFADKGKKEAVE